MPASSANSGARYDFPCARAYIRHRFTSYHDDLDSLSPEHWDEEYLYREIKGAANEAVDRFLLEHRRS